MENNFNESMNLGGMASSGYASAEPAVQPVFTTSTTVWHRQVRSITQIIMY